MVLLSYLSCSFLDNYSHENVTCEENDTYSVLFTLRGYGPDCSGGVFSLWKDGRFLRHGDAVLLYGLSRGDDCVFNMTRLLNISTESGVCYRLNYADALVCERCFHNGNTHCMHCFSVVKSGVVDRELHFPFQNITGWQKQLDSILDCNMPSKELCDLDSGLK